MLYDRLMSFPLQSANGQLGFQNDSKASRVQHVPTDIPFLENVQFSAVATGPNHAVGLSVDGKVYAWGSGEQGRLMLQYLCSVFLTTVPQVNLAVG